MPPYLILSVSVSFDQQLPALGLLVVIHSSHVLMMDLVDSSMQGTRTLEREYRSRHEYNNNNNNNDDGIDDPENEVRTPFHNWKHVILFELGMKCECIMIHDWMTTVARNDANLKPTILQHHQSKGESRSPCFTITRKEKDKKWFFSTRSRQLKGVKVV